MKLKVIAAIIPALFVFSSVAAEIEGGTTTVTFNGEITSSSCEIDSGNSSLMVAMGTVSDNVLNTAGVSSDKDFNIALTGCSDGALKTVTGVFKGNTINGDAKKLTTNNETVAIEVKQNGTSVLLDGSGATAAVDFDEDGNANMPFTANYRLIGDSAKSGDANGSVDFTVYYQ